MNQDKRPKLDTLLLWGFALLAVASFVVWSLPSDEDKRAKQYADNVTAIAAAQASIIRAKADCQADAVEFPSIPTIAQQCRETFRIVAESEAEMIKARTEANQLLTSRYCPGEPWCPK